MIDLTTAPRVVSNDRYSGRPLVPLLECYVLWAIGELGGEQAAVLAEMTPGLRSVYRADGDWHDVIAAAMRWRPDMPQRIRAAWARYVLLRRGASPPSARAFAEAFVDDRFVPRATAPRPIGKPRKSTVTAFAAITTAREP
jgi:hypothetical protein